MVTGSGQFDEKRLIHALRHGGTEERRQAAQELGRNASAVRDVPTAVRALCAALGHDSSDSVREWSAWALGMIGNASARLHLENGLGQEMRDVRVHCALALARVRSKASIPALNQYLSREDDPIARAFIVQALGKFVSDEGVRSTLAAIRSNSSETDDVRRSASQALSGSRDLPEPGESPRPSTIPFDMDDGSQTMQPWIEPEVSQGGTEMRTYYATRPVRNSAIAENHKRRHLWRCQVCGADGFPMKGGGKYAEAHHIKPLEDHGSDVPENLLCVCPLCHRLLHHAPNVEYVYEPGSNRPTAVPINRTRYRIRWDG